MPLSALRARVDDVLVVYAAGLAASFGISHIDAIHLRLQRHFPKFYPYLNVVLPCGRAIFGLAILARGTPTAPKRCT